MTYQEFVDKYNNKGIDFDGYYGYQCMDLAHQYAVDVIGHDFAPAPAAKDVFDQAAEGYDKIYNTPDGVPQKGDIIIWGVGVGLYGHIAIFDHGDQNSFTSFDQNWPLNSLCHFQTHNYNGVLGWFHPHSAIIAQPIAQELNDQTKIPASLLGTNEPMEIQAIRGKLGDLAKAEDQVKQLESVNTEQATQIQQLQEDLKGATSPQDTSFSPTTPLGQLFLKIARSFG